MPFLHSTVFQTWKTTFQLFQADSFTHKRLKFESLLLCALESSAIILRDQISPPQIILLDSTAVSSWKAWECNFMLQNLQRRVKRKTTHLQYGNQAAETTVSKPCYNSYICFRLFWHILLTPTLCWSMQFEEDCSYTPPNPQRGYYNPF